ncbi:hypothetical protein E2C01_034095 [Portunus trituberculatus]|uniref:Uncharacterized protein n=1 Tax=Portunus trituberculatus TaxID=210409 RepID=A0A5B7F4J8_PORTR|nr:hypothetical protein [Portunus trituberculatus]
MTVSSLPSRFTASSLATPCNQGVRAKGCAAGPAGRRGGVSGGGRLALGTLVSLHQDYTRGNTGRPGTNHLYCPDTKIPRVRAAGCRSLDWRIIRTEKKLYCRNIKDLQITSACY